MSRRPREGGRLACVEFVEEGEGFELELFELGAEFRGRERGR